VRISSANILAHVSRTQSSPPARTADRVAEQQQTGQDRYRKNTAGSGQVIDAEYVEFYSPSKQTFAQERQRLDERVEPESETSSPGKSTTKLSNNAIDSYQLKAHEAPPPGSFIDIFA